MSKTKLFHGQGRAKSQMCGYADKTRRAVVTKQGQCYTKTGNSLPGIFNEFFFDS